MGEVELFKTIEKEGKLSLFPKITGLCDCGSAWMKKSFLKSGVIIFMQSGILQADGETFRY